MPVVTTISATVQISARAAAQIKRGGLWIYSNEVHDKSQITEPGEWCWFASNGSIVGTGYFNAHSLIAGRVVAFDRQDDIESLLVSRIKAAVGRRPLSRLQESARLIFGEADLLPGLIADLFSGALVLQSNTAGMDRVLEAVTQIAENVLEEAGLKDSAVVWRKDSSIRALEGLAEGSEVKTGTESDLRKWFFKEAGLTYCADLLDGQKTGFFLDQRENRDFLSSWLEARPGAKVVDLFCYSGGWGFRALKSAADRVVFVDQSEAALDLVKWGAEKNRFEHSKFETVASDVFDYLSHGDDHFDVVVADPPAFVKTRKNLPQAEKAYEKLARLAWRRVRPGGLLMFSSCSFHLLESDFLEIAREAVAKEGGLAHVVYRGKQGADHPMLLSMPETRYLKCVGLQKL
jgi:23S rRNA (cytosine1962-C5)-methyltransferase